MIGNVTMKRLTGGVNPIMTTGVQLLIGNAPLVLSGLVLENSTPIRWQTSQRALGRRARERLRAKRSNPKCRAAAPVPAMRAYRDPSREKIF
jgi:hypothetical protein